MISKTLDSHKVDHYVCHDQFWEMINHLKGYKLSAKTINHYFDTLVPIYTDYLYLNILDPS